MSYEITAPSAANAQGYYSKSLEIFGIPILGTAEVDDEAFYAAAEIVGNVIINSPILRELLAYKGGTGLKIGIIDSAQFMTDMPEYLFLKNVSTFDGRSYADLRGVGATTSTPMTSVGEENLLNYPSDPYHGLESVLLHEFIHGIEAFYPAIGSKITATYNHAVSEGLWTNTYAISNQAEYFAEITQTWFNDNPDVAAADGTNHPVNTRAELKLYDIDGYNLMASLYRDDDWTDGKFFGSKNDDVIMGTQHADLIFGRAGDDLITGGTGNNLIYADDGEDMVVVFAGINLIEGGNGSDFLIGGSMADHLDGGAGNDLIRGESDGAFMGGSDTLTGGTGNDLLMGGKGADTFMFKANEGIDFIGAFDTSSVLFTAGIGYTATANGADFVSGFDQIMLDGFVSVNASNLFDFITDDGSDAVFNADGTQIRFIGVLEAELQASDFVFA